MLISSTSSAGEDVSLLTEDSSIAQTTDPVELESEAHEEAVEHSALLAELNDKVPSPDPGQGTAG
jgi:hypothetical protein